jgi:dUTP pyrophosphatase
MATHKTIDVPILNEEGAELPKYASQGASGADIKAFIVENIVLLPGTTALVPTGLRLAIPEGYEIQVRPRSGLALKHSISVLNTPGTIDADYRGELGILLINHGKEPFVITPGMRIAQIVLTPVLQANFCIHAELATTVRGSGGYGHTGTH